jgi:hypothetical protein
MHAFCLFNKAMRSMDIIEYSIKIQVGTIFSQNFCDYKNTDLFPVQIWIWKSVRVKTCETRKSGNSFLSHCLTFQSK